MIGNMLSKLYGSHGGKHQPSKLKGTPAVVGHPASQACRSQLHRTTTSASHGIRAGARRVSLQAGAGSNEFHSTTATAAAEAARNASLECAGPSPDLGRVEDASGPYVGALPDSDAQPVSELHRRSSMTGSRLEEEPSDPQASCQVTGGDGGSSNSEAAAAARDPGASDAGDILAGTGGRSKSKHLQRLHDDNKKRTIQLPRQTAPPISAYDQIAPYDLIVSGREGRPSLEPESDSARLDRLVAQSLALNEEVLHGTAWDNDADWDLGGGGTQNLTAGAGGGTQSGNGAGSSGATGRSNGGGGGHVDKDHAAAGRTGAGASASGRLGRPSFEPESDFARLDRLVAQSLALNEEALKGTAWNDNMDWELATEVPLDLTADAGDGRQGGGVGAGTGRRGLQRRGPRRASLDDDDVSWEYGTYQYSEQVSQEAGGGGGGKGLTATAAAASTAPSAAAASSGPRKARDGVLNQRAERLAEGSRVSRRGIGEVDVDAATADLRPKQRDRVGGLHRGHRDRWVDDGDTDNDEGLGGLGDPLADLGDPLAIFKKELRRATRELREVEAELREQQRGDDWGKAGSLPGEWAGGVDLDAAAWGLEAGPDAVVGTAAAGGGGSRAGGGGKGAARAAESKMRKAVAAASTQQPRMGLAVTFPLPPAGPAAADDTLAAAVAHSAAASGPSAREATPARTAAAAGSLDWTTVPLSYNFGPNFKLLENNAMPLAAPLPPELVTCAGGLLGADGGGDSAEGGTRRRQRHPSPDALLPGCTAYTMAENYQILLVQNDRSVAAALTWLVASLEADRVVGLDAEWPPTFRAGESQQLAMLQLASPSRVVLLHIARMKRLVMAHGGPLHSLLSDASLTWVACGWGQGDRAAIAAVLSGPKPVGSVAAAGKAGKKSKEAAEETAREEEIVVTLPRAVVDVQVAARMAGWPRLGLLGLVADLLGAAEFRKPRKLTISNWATAALSDRQLRYAALDALLPPLLLRQLRLFAAMPGLRCGFCRQPMHAPPGALQQQPPAPLPPTSATTTSTPARPQPCIVCEHCGRSFWRSTSQKKPPPQSHPHPGQAQVRQPGRSGQEQQEQELQPTEIGGDGAQQGQGPPPLPPAVTEGLAEDGGPWVGPGAAAVGAGSQGPTRPAGGSKSLREYLQGVLEGRPHPSTAAAAAQGRSRRVLFRSDLVHADLGVASKPGSRVASDSGSGSESDSEGSDRAGSKAKAGNRKSKSKVKRSKKLGSDGGGGSAVPTSARQQAVWATFAESSPAAAAGVSLAVSAPQEQQGVRHQEEQLEQAEEERSGDAGLLVAGAQQGD